ncbi:uncharacterized protein LOC111059798 [Nilaparvata lugens]|uniref:uncharacterized protein LOC111059798 n=1 Tax=Nilaparvata lugens TaxID=108931 RepID=UPI000B97D437|nr:uncharacterized protein LOC111059798 [Nilaparvata lugens]
MAGPIIERSLCGYSLKTACKIIGWLGVVGWGTLLVGLAVNFFVLIEQDEQEYSWIFISIILALPLFMIAYNIMVLVAVEKRWPGLLLPYMVFTMIHVVGGLVRIGVSIRYENYNALFYFSKAVFDIYFLLLVSSYYLQLRIIKRDAGAV